MANVVNFFIKNTCIYCYKNMIGLSFIYYYFLMMEQKFLDLSELADFTASAVENDTVSFIATYADGQVFTCNRAFCRLTGYTKKEISNMKWPGDFTPPEQQEPMGKLIHNVACDVAPYRFDKEMIKKEGTRVPVELFVHKFCDTAGKPQYFYSFITDMSEHKRLEKALKDSEAKYRELVENANSIILRMDVVGNVTFFNEFAQKFFGYSSEEMIGNNVIGSIVPKTESSGRDLEAMIYDIGMHPELYINNENENIKRNGARVWISWTNKAIRDNNGRIIEILCVGNDITALKKAETALIKARDELEIRVLERTEELKKLNEKLLFEISERKLTEKELIESEQRFRTTFEQAAVGIAHLDPDGNFIRINNKFCDIIGYQCYQILNMKLQEITHYYDIEDLLSLIKKILSKYIDSGSMELRCIRKDETAIWLNITISLLCSEDGKPKYFIVVAEDINDRKKAEFALEDAISQSELYLDLMGHDINNMNQAILGYLEIALDTLKLDKDQKYLLSKPIEIVNQSSKLIDNVKKLKRIKYEKDNMKIIDLGKILLDVKEKYAKTPGRNISINYDHVSGYKIKAPEMTVDIFDNLVGNAIKHSTGPLIINISLNKTVRNGKDFYETVIEDTGPGISDDYKKRIFMFSGKDLLKSSRRGLGLHLVKALVEILNGKIVVEDRIKGDHTEGAKFIVDLPVFEKTV